MGSIAIISSLIPIIYEDFKFRAIHWYWLVVLLALVLITQPFDSTQIAFNVFFLLIQFLGLTIYFSIKNKQLTNIVDNYIGMGDLLFFIPLCWLFTPTAFIFFFTASLLFSLIGFLLLKQFWKKNLETIPLAGTMSICMIIVLLFQ